MYTERFLYYVPLWDISVRNYSFCFVLLNVHVNASGSGYRRKSWHWKQMLSTYGGTVSYSMLGITQMKIKFTYFIKWPLNCSFITNNWILWQNTSIFKNKIQRKILWAIPLKFGYNHLCDISMSITIPYLCGCNSFGLVVGVGTGMGIEAINLVNAYCGRRACRV